VTSDTRKISIVIPVLNEEESIKPLYDKIQLELKGFNKEIIFVNDGSSDNSFNEIQDIINQDANVRMISFFKNYGKATALSEAFKISSGNIVVTIDADLQDDPSEIKNMIEKIDEGWDLVSGWKKKRKDPIMKKIASKVFNFITRLKTGIRIHDFNCGLKAYNSKVIKTIQLYGHLHRFIPVLAYNEGYKVTEVEVNHYPRKFGETKYGKSRFFHGFYDFLTIIFLNKYLDRPMHFFGRFGLFFTLTGLVINMFLTYQWICYWFSSVPIENEEFTIIRPLFFLGILLIVIGVQFFSIGFVGEMIVKKMPNSSPVNFDIISKED